MENIILTNNKDLRLVGVKVGVLSTLRFELPLVSASATHVEVIVTSGNVHSAYTATFIDATKRWQCDIAASQFPTVGKQSYEVAYVLDGKQFWDGKGWIEIEDATTSGIEPQPRPEPYRYAVVSVNGYGADAQGAVRIPKTFISANSPVTTEGYIEGDIYFNRETGAMWTLCNVQGTLTWVFNYKNYYTKAETDEAIDRIAAYYITYNAAGAAFPTRAALVNALTYYSGGVARTPTRNDYAVVLADETHDGAEWRYIYAVADGQTTGQWEAQYPVEGVITFDNSVTRTSTNGVKSSGIWSAIWGALSALPTGFASLYDWCVSQLAGKASTADATLTTRGYSEWTILRDGVDVTEQVQQPHWEDDPEAAYVDVWVVIDTYIQGDGGVSTIPSVPRDAVALSWNGFSGDNVRHSYTATRTALQGYQLGSQTTKSLASEAEAEALRTAIADKANRATNPTAGHLAALDANGNPTDSTLPAANVAMKGNIPYALGTPTVIDTASSETVEGETVYYGSAALANRTANIVQVTAATALDELRITFPAATSGKVRDFGLRVEIGTGSAALTAPALVPTAPTGETIKLENNAAEIPALANGTATAKGVTLLYFSENAPGVFVVKGEQVEEVA